MDQNWRNDYDLRRNPSYDHDYPGSDYNTDREYGSSRMYTEGVSGEDPDRYRERMSGYGYDDASSMYGSLDRNTGRRSSGITAGSNVVNPGERNFYGTDNERNIFERAGGRIRETRDERDSFERSGDRMRDTWNDWPGDIRDRNTAAAAKNLGNRGYGDYNLSRGYGGYGSAGGAGGDYRWGYDRERSLNDRDRGNIGSYGSTEGYGANYGRERGQDYDSRNSRDSYGGRDYRRNNSRSDYDRRG
jgi:hypothetical protein